MGYKPGSPIFLMCRLGVDCPSQLEWRNWVPGTEYVKHLVVKNVSSSTLKLKYAQADCKTFSMDFAEPFKLRPGMSKSLKASLSHAFRNADLCCQALRVLKLVKVLLAGCLPATEAATLH